MNGAARIRTLFNNQLTCSSYGRDAEKGARDSPSPLMAAPLTCASKPVTTHRQIKRDLLSNLVK